MMLMTKFGKFKLRLIATINLSVLLSIFNIASTTSNYWIKYIDSTGESHFAGLWRSCPKQGPCVWKNGIVDGYQSFWSLTVRFFLTLGTIANCVSILIFFLAFFYKLNKKTRSVIRLMEVGNLILISAFIFILFGFCVFISNTCNFAMWLHVISLITITITSNIITRTFAKLYFINTRSVQCSKSVEAAISHSKLTCDPEEKIALTPVSKDAITSTENPVSQPVITSAVSQQAINAIEINKVSETNGSNEALIQASQPLLSAANTEVAGGNQEA